MSLSGAKSLLGEAHGAVPMREAIVCHLEGHLARALRELAASPVSVVRDAVSGVLWASGVQGDTARASRRLEGACGGLEPSESELLRWTVEVDRAAPGQDAAGDDEVWRRLAAIPTGDALPPILRALGAVAAARARRRGGRPAEARAELVEWADHGEHRGWPRLQWWARAEAARACEMLDDEPEARVHRRAALETLEGQALALPPAHRGAFWDHPARRDGGGPSPDRTEARSGSARGAGWRGAGWRADEATEGPEPSHHRPGLEERVARLLDVLERLTAEHDLDRLLERITDSAVELTGAERGFVLLVDEEGGLEPEPRLARARGTRAEDPSIRFSRSIAEAVLIDGDPIVTVDARDDRRLSEYLSVHHLQLRSVACLPIRSHGRVEGVLYLEHRVRRGRFGEGEDSLLRAFADQAAIALSNARLLAQNHQRQQELERKNRELREAKEQLEHLVAARTAELEEARYELGRARGDPATDYERHGLIGRSEPMRRVFAVIDRVRDTDVPVVIQGESGTGKELIARALHYAGSRAHGPFVALHCGAVPEALLETELFGHVRGAFTGADRARRGVLSRASGGTLFLDEVADMPPKMQVELLRVLSDGKVCPVGGEDEQEVDVRIVAATQRSLRELVAAGRFREDLFYRLDVVEIAVPPLRERREDVPLLCRHFLRRFADREGGGPRRLSRAALGRLCGHPLPGNVRQLEHVLLNACVMAEGEVVDESDLPFDSSEARRVALPAAPSPGSGSEASPASRDEYKDVERRRILEALEQHGWNRARAARALGMPRRTFYRRLKEFAIQ